MPLDFARAGANLPIMRKTILSAMLLCALAAPALADNYPVTGAWGQSTSSEKGAIDCAGKRVITFNGNQRTDSKGGVPAYRNKSVTAAGTRTIASSTSSATARSTTRSVNYTLRQVDRRSYRDEHAVRRAEAAALRVAHLRTAMTAKSNCAR